MLIVPYLLKTELVIENRCRKKGRLESSKLHGIRACRIAKGKNHNVIK